jgi:DNA-binding CsgD family transcriptional regulator
MNRDFKGVWIPKEIYLDKNLSWTEKILLIEIQSLQGEDGCWASNQYLAEFLGLSEKTVKNLLTALRQKELLDTKTIDGSRRLFVRSRNRDHEVPKKGPAGPEIGTPIYRKNNTENKTVVVEAATADSAFDLYRKYYPQVPLHIFNQEMLMSLEKHLDVFKEVLDIWVGRQYREQNIKGMMSLYERLLTDKNNKEQKLFCGKCEGNSGWLPDGEGWVRCQH